MGIVDYRDWDKPKTITKEYKSKKLFEFPKYLFSYSFRKNIKYVLRGVSEIEWYLADGDKKIKKTFTVFFYENHFDDRKYEISGVGYDLTYWPRLKEFHHMELWLRSGIKPDWYEDILQRKMMK